MKFIGIIPARYESTRFPGKPLADINGKPMIQRVYENVAGELSGVWVATDDQRIFDAVARFGGKAILTSTAHRSGTDRVAEAAEIISANTDFDVVVNIQGDEPFVSGGQIRALKECFSDETEIATLVRIIEEINELFDQNKPKVVVSDNKNALYFSRSTIPFLRGVEKDEWLREATFYAHVGIYAYRKDILKKLSELKPGILEQAESLEQLRWLENGFSIKTAVTDYSGFGIDTPEDLARALQLFE